MKLKQAATFFDKTVAKDAYNHAKRFKCQLEPLDLYRMDGARIKLRGMSTAPTVNIPERKVIHIDGQNYLVSDKSNDQWAGEAIRSRYVIQGADSVVQIASIADILAGTAGTLAFASIDFNRYSTDERDSSDYHPQYHIYFGGTETVSEHNLITTADRVYLVKSAHKTTAGLVDALSNLLDDPVIDTATFGSRAYDPISDTYTDTTSTVRCIRIRWQDHFNYLSQGSEKFERADMVVLVPLSMAPKSGDTITLDAPWRVVSVVDYADYRSLHVRRL
jgi:hypothetical protein